MARIIYSSHSTVRIFIKQLTRIVLYSGLLCVLCYGVYKAHTQYITTQRTLIHLENAVQQQTLRINRLEHENMVLHAELDTVKALTTTD